jgi:hypothetical protein
MGILLSMRKTNFKHETFQKIELHVSQGNDFISQMQKNMTSSFTIGLMESNKINIYRIYLLGGVIPFTSQGKFLYLGFKLRGCMPLYFS